MYWLEEYQEKAPKKINHVFLRNLSHDYLKKQMIIPESFYQMNILEKYIFLQNSKNNKGSIFFSLNGIKELKKAVDDNLAVTNEEVFIDLVINHEVLYLSDRLMNEIINQDIRTIVFLDMGPIKKIIFKQPHCLSRVIVNGYEFRIEEDKPVKEINYIKLFKHTKNYRKKSTISKIFKSTKFKLEESIITSQ